MSNQVIIFDLYGTLVDIHTDEMKDSVWETMSWFYRLHQVSISPKKLRKRIFQLIHQLEQKKKKELGKDRIPEIDLTRVFKSLFDEHGVQCDEDLARKTCIFFRALTIERLRLYQGTIPLLNELKKAGKSLYLLTNAQQVFTEKEIQMLGLESYFDGIMYSSAEGIKKPDAEFFKCLMKRYQLNAEECVMIGNDALCDVAGALNVNMHAVHVISNIRGNGKCQDSVRQFKVTEFDELAELLIKGL